MGTVGGTAVATHFGAADSETTMAMAGVVTKKEKSSTFVGRLGSIAVCHYPASKDNFGITAIAKKASARSMFLLEISGFFDNIDS